MIKGDIVMIYQDPITQLKPEGKARLVCKIMDWEDGIERWRVHFLEDGPDETFERNIKIK